MQHTPSTVASGTGTTPAAMGRKRFVGWAHGDEEQVPALPERSEGRVRALVDLRRPDSSETEDLAPIAGAG